MDLDRAVELDLRNGSGNETALSLSREIRKAHPTIRRDTAAKIAREHAAQMVVDVTAQQKKTVQRLTARALTEGWTQRELQERIHDVVGLNERDQRAVENFRDSPAMRRLPDGMRRLRVSQYAARLRKKRARVIARQELKASQMGAQRVLWHEDKIAGRHRNKVRRSVPKDGCCPKCAEEEHVLREIEDEQGPPWHVNCRCTQRLEDRPGADVIKTAKTRKVRTAEGAEWYGQPIGAVIRAKDRRSDDGQQGRTEGDRRASGEVSPAVPGPGVDGRRDSGVRGAGLLKAKGFTVKQRLPDTSRTQQLKERGNNTDPLFEVDAAADKGRFRQAMMDSLKDNPYAASVYVYPEDDYGEMRLFLTADGLAGIALHGDEIVSAFSSQGRGIGPHLVSQGVAQGGRRLDAFDTVLPKIYASEGFTTAARLKWDDNYAPDAWDKNVFRRFNNGEPDVVFMFYSAALDRAYSPSEGAYVSDYDAGLAATKERAKEKMIRRFKGLSKAERRVKTPEGAKWYGQPIGSVTKSDPSPAAIRLGDGFLFKGRTHG